MVPADAGVELGGQGTSTAALQRAFQMHIPWQREYQ